MGLGFCDRGGGGEGPTRVSRTGGKRYLDLGYRTAVDHYFTETKLGIWGYRKEGAVRERRGG